MTPFHYNCDLQFYNKKNHELLNVKHPIHILKIIKETVIQKGQLSLTSEQDSSKG